MAHKDQFLTFYIVLTSAADVAANQALYPTGVIRGPQPAATEFNAPLKGSTDPALVGQNYIWSPWLDTSDSHGPFLLDRAVFSRHSGGWFGIGGTTIRYIWVGQFVQAPPATPTFNNAPITPSAIPQRTWTIGFEDCDGGEFGAVPSNIVGFFLNESSRHPGQRGFAMRGCAASGSVNVNAFRPAYSPSNDWEWVYVRGRVPDTLISCPFWRSHDNGADAGGAEMFYTPGGSIACVNNDGGAGTVWPLGVIPLTAGEFARIDIITSWNSGSAYHYGSSNGNAVQATQVVGAGIGNGVQDGVSQIQIGGANGINSGVFTITSHLTDSVSFVGPVIWYDKPYADLPTTPHSWTITSVGGGVVQFYKNGALVVDALITVAMAGIGRSGGKHGRTSIGNDRATVNKAELDLDDWGCADAPNLLVPSLDWLNGRKMTLVRPTGFGASHANWAGDFRVLDQQATLVGSNKATVSSSTGAAHMAVTTDAENVVDAESGSLGAVAVNVWMGGVRGAGSGSLGYSLAGAGEVMTAVTQPAAFGPNGVLISFTQPTDITPLELRHIKGAAADAATVSILGATVEILGTFGPEDVLVSEQGGASVPTFPRVVGQHNGPYPRSPWARTALAPPASPIVIKSGTYAGNNTGQQLAFRTPVHWMFVRPLTGGAGGWKWWSTMSGSHRFDVQGIEAQHMVRAVEDFTFTPAGIGDDQQQTQYLVHISGSHAQSNATGVTYQYVAFSDPGMRFVENGMFLHPAAVASFLNSLQNSVFAPQWMWLFPEELSNNAGGQWMCQSEGHASDSITKAAGSTTASALTRGTGGFTSYAALHSATLWVPYSCWRRSDGNADPGEVNIAAYSYYTGDGAASRSIAFTPASTKRPLLAIVCPENAIAIIRDPSHTGTTSETEAGGANAATGITAGAINGMSVGIALNANGIKYHYFVLFGSDVAGNNGWSGNGEFIPVETDSPINGPFVPTTLPSETTTTPSVSVPDDISTDIGTACVQASTHMCNLALSAIGVSKQLTNLGTDVSEEADTCRLQYGMAVAATLRAHDWSFATRYDALALVAGTATVPVNNDWQYAYRVPTNMKRARRVTKPGMGRTFDPAPYTFAVGADATGSLIYSNVPNDQIVDSTGTVVAGTGTPLQLEYTLRVDCPAAAGDDLFRQALMFKIATGIAPALAKDETKVKWCAAMFDYCVRLAKGVDASEQQPEQMGDASWIRDRN